MVDMECMNKVMVDTSSCLKPCSGLIITTLAKTEPRRNLETLFSDFGNYKNYKIDTGHPHYGKCMSPFLVCYKTSFPLSAIVRLSEE